MNKFEELLARSIANQNINRAKVLNNARTWFTYPTPGQPGSERPYIVTPESTFQPVVESTNCYSSYRCPTCGAQTAVREKRRNGYDVCDNGHKYLSSDAIFIGQRNGENV